MTADRRKLKLVQQQISRIIDTLEEIEGDGLTNKAEWIPTGPADGRPYAIMCSRCLTVSAAMWPYCPVCGREMTNTRLEPSY